MAMMRKAKNLVQVSKGRVKETVGGAVGDVNLEAEGRRDQRMGNLKRASEKVKDAFRRH
jgi:uncharacterized protein YjbJ (UPF0337 family)